METKFYQHGDVLLYVENEIPKGLEKCDHNRIQEGESTGHAHRLFGDGFTIFKDPKTQERTHLEVVKPVSLKHEEHKEIVLPPNKYRIGIVREYDHFDEEAKQVVD